MKRVALFTVMFLLVAGIAFAKEYEITKKAGPYTVDVKIDNNPPVAGNNNLSIEVKDANGKYVTDAKVEVVYSMAAMPGMPPMNYKAVARPGGNEYKAKMNLSMSGSWTVEVKVSKGGKTQKAQFTVDAH
jgi:hypothetical protein